MYPPIVSGTVVLVHPLCTAEVSRTVFRQARMESQLLIAGAGLAGLTAAWQLHRHGVDTLLVEARERVGGRAYTLNILDGDFDFGPSWIWPGQPTVSSILSHFSISTYPQYSLGDLLYQLPDGSLQRDKHLKPMQGALRIDRGVTAIANALHAELPKDSVVFNTPIQALRSENGKILVKASTSGQETTFNVDQVAIAFPLRLAAKCSYSPSLDLTSIRKLNNTPTWMAAHAKFYAVYTHTFWRDSGLSGAVHSQRGPLGEIHDASPYIGPPYALFGFFRIDSHKRTSMTQQNLLAACVAQLVDLFGSAAASPKEVKLVDWSQDPWTASVADQELMRGHPQYGVRFQLHHPWNDKLHFIVSETADLDGGLIEGALHQGLNFANDLLRQKGISIKDFKAKG